VTAPRPPLLRARAIAKHYGPVAALRGADLTVHPGEIVAVAGENGSGKSTLARIIAGAVSPDEGAVELDGRPVSFARPGQALAAGICLVSQEPTLVPDLSVAENVLLPRLSRPAVMIRRSALAAQARPFLARVGLAAVDPMRPAAALLPGEAELVELAKALAASPKLLILDEVTSRLPDPRELFRVVEDITRAGAGVIFITHRLREIRRLADRAVVLRDGHSVAVLDRADLTDERLSSAMVGRTLGEFFHKSPVALGDVRLEVRDVVTDRSPHPVSLTVRAGEIVGVAGLVGSGRSELLETIAGVRRARHGQILLDGAPRARGSLRAARQAGVVLVPEDRLGQGLAPQHSILDNLAVPWLRSLHRTRRASDHARAAAAVADYRIRCRSVRSAVADLSGGNAQKVLIAQALQQGPRLLLLDEPTRGVDIGSRSDIYGFLTGLAEQGTGLLIASSDLMELLGLADRILVLAEGRLAGELSRADATEERIVLLALGGEHYDAA
jgi:ABC-type sugar transport system ATPase subunit